MIEIATILSEMDQIEAAKRWFRKCYNFVFANYPAQERRSMLDDIQFFEVLEEAGFEMREVIVTIDL